MREKYNTVKQAKSHASYEKDKLYEIIDEALLANISFVDEDGNAAIIPTNVWRIDDTLYFHGHKKSRLVKAATQQRCAISVVIFDGWKMARSAFNHGARYRSAVIFGTFSEVNDLAERNVIFDDLLNKMVTNRASQVRPGSKREMEITAVLKLKLDDFSVKVNSGFVEDAKTDLASKAAAGIFPAKITFGEFIRNPDLADDVPSLTLDDLPQK